MCEEAKVVPVAPGFSALFFAVRTQGGSGWQVEFALLRPGEGKELENLFPSDMAVTNQSQHAFCNEPTISDSLIFVTADYVWGPDEAHLGDHRFIISSYTRRPSTMPLGVKYYLDDRFMTIRKYNSYDSNLDVLGREKEEILARLLKVKTQRPAR
jgi:hypothetical protein